MCDESCAGERHRGNRGHRCDRVCILSMKRRSSLLVLAIEHLL